MGEIGKRVFNESNKNNNKRIENCKLEIENLSLELKELENEKTYIDWYRKYLDDVKLMDGYDESSKIEKLRRYISEIEVTFNGEFHILNIKFNNKIVNDKLIWKDIRNKKLKYDLYDGESNKVVYQSKKKVLDMLEMKEWQMKYV
jgi:hypothetical protein